MLWIIDPCSAGGDTLCPAHGSGLNSRLMSPSNRTALTFRYECWRAVSSGMIETAGATFLPLTAGMIAWLTGVIPNIARLILSPLWGWLFDHMNFFILRITLNAGFALGILAFFVTHSMTGLVIGAIVYGISNAGGDVAWNLWVTKFAPPNRVADYMSAHAFFTGVRGVLAPLAAFQLISGISLFTLGWISVGLIAIGTAFLFPEIKFGRSPHAVPVRVEEVE